MASERRIHIKDSGYVYLKAPQRRTLKDGSVSVYQNPIWYIEYKLYRRLRQESSHSTDQQTAIELLHNRLKHAQRGHDAQREEKFTFTGLKKLLLDNYEINKKRSIRSAKLSVRHLERFFGRMRAIEIKLPAIQEYISLRQSTGASNASINRELSALKRMFTLAVQGDILSKKPHIPPLEENNVRQGFVDSGDFLAVKKHLPLEYQDPVSFLYLSAQRLSVMKNLLWSHVDEAGGVIYLPSDLQKNKKTLLLPIHGEIAAIIERESTDPFVLRTTSKTSSFMLGYNPSWLVMAISESNQQGR